MNNSPDDWDKIFHVADHIWPWVAGLFTAIGGSIGYLVRKHKRAIGRIETLEKIAERDAMEMVILRETQKGILEEMKGIRKDLLEYISHNHEAHERILTSMHRGRDE